MIPTDLPLAPPSTNLRQDLPLCAPRCVLKYMTSTFLLCLELADINMLAPHHFRVPLSYLNTTPPRPSTAFFVKIPPPIPEYLRLECFFFGSPAPLPPLPSTPIPASGRLFAFGLHFPLFENIPPSGMTLPKLSHPSPKTESPLYLNMWSILFSILLLSLPLRPVPPGHFFFSPPIPRIYGAVFLPPPLSCCLRLLPSAPDSK